MKNHSIRLTITMLASIALLIIATPVADAFTSGEELTRFGSSGLGAGQLSFPEAIATSPRSGHVYVTGRGDANRIDEYTPWGGFVKAIGWDVSPGAVNEQQEVKLRAASGTFVLSFDGSTTGDLSLGAPGSIDEAEGKTGSIEQELNALPSVDGSGGSVSVEAVPGTPDGRIPYVYVVSFRGSFSGTDVAQIVPSEGSVPLTGGTPTTSLEVTTRVNGSGPTAGLEGCTTESGCQGGARGAGAGQLDGPGGIAVNSQGDLYVVEDQGDERVQKLNPEGRFLLMFGGGVLDHGGTTGTGDLTAGSTTIQSVHTTARAFVVGQTLEAPGLAPDSRITAFGPGTIVLSKPAQASESAATLAVRPTAGVAPNNEKQKLTITGEPTGGTFSLEFKTPLPDAATATTAPIAFNASSAEVEERLAALSNIGSGNVGVTGPNGGPYTVEFKGSRFADTNVNPLLGDARNLLPEVGLQKNILVRTLEDGASAASICTAADLSNGIACDAGGIGDLPGQFRREPGGGQGIAIGPSGEILVAQTERIERFSAEGVYEASIAVPGFSIHQIAIDPTSGDLYVTVGPVGASEVVNNVLKLNPITGAETGKLIVKKPGAISVDESGDLYVVEPEINENSIPQPESILQFSSAGQSLSPPSCCAPPEPFTSRGLATNAVGDLYSVSLVLGGGEAFIGAFGPGPVAFEAPPKIPPAILSQFAQAVHAEDATVGAFINPKFWTDTKYYVEYGIGRCTEGGCGHIVPVAPGRVLAQRAFNGPVRAEGLELEGLSPSATYHYRFVAQSSGGGPVFGIDPDGEGPLQADRENGQEGTFTTLTPRSVERACPNAAFRTGPSAVLPDCRAYEMVSPVDKDGADVKVSPDLPGFGTALPQAAAGGERFTFSSYHAFADAKGAPFTVQYLSSRAAGVGWSTRAISAPQSLLSNEVFALPVNAENQFKAFSPDLCQGWMAIAGEPVLAPGAPDGFVDLYHQDTCGPESYEALVRVDPTVDHGAFEPELEALSKDGSAAIIRANDKLTPDASGGSVSQAYYAIAGSLRLICILPDGSVSPGNCSAGYMPEQRGALASPVHGRGGSLTNALSQDGSKAYWTASGSQTLPGQFEEGKIAGTGRIFLRLNPGAEQSNISLAKECTEPEKACTVPVSETKSTSAARFLRATPDGTSALYEFTEGSLSGNLYRFDEDSGTSTLIARRTLGLVGAGENLDDVYFVSEERLAGTSGATAGRPNLYVNENGSPSFIATLSQTDVTRVKDPEATESIPSDTQLFSVYQAARASSDGNRLAFISDAKLTGFDNTDATSTLPCGVKEGSREGMCDSEVYVYTVGERGPVCVSCNAGGAQPIGREVERYPNSGAKLATSGSLPLAENQLYTPRVFSTDGSRLFFDSFDALVPRDTNHAEDVYEWQASPDAEKCEKEGAELYVPSNAGCISLISDGEAAGNSQLQDISEEGKDAFFITGAGLLPQDPGLVDVYDARAGGGLPAPAGAALPCNEEHCQSPGEAAAASPPPASATAKPGNPPRRLCTRKKVAGRKRCTSKHKTGHHRRAHPKHHSRHARKHAVHKESSHDTRGGK